MIKLVTGEQAVAALRPFDPLPDNLGGATHVGMVVAYVLIHGLDALAVPPGGSTWMITHGGRKLRFTFLEDGLESFVALEDMPGPARGAHGT